MVEDSVPLSELAPLAPLMAVLALGTWWLVKNAPGDEGERPLAAPRHVPDYVMQRFSSQRFDASGKSVQQLEGEVLRHYPDDDSVEVDQIRLRATDEQGLVTQASARLAQAKGDLSEVKLQGGARVLREPLPGGRIEDHLEFRGEFLHLLVDAKRVRSDQPVVLISGRNQIQAGR